jgi:MATE family multidrug resistance protein
MRSRELSWTEAPFTELMRLAWPITVSTLSYSVMTLVDTLLVGRLGPSALAGVGLGGTASFVLLCFSFGLLRGSKTLVSQTVGAGRLDEVAPQRAAALTFGLAAGVITAGVGQLVALTLPLMSATAAAGEAARVYLAIRALGAPITLVHTALREVRYAQGDARTPMHASVIANLVNTALASLFVYGLHWGVAGAGWATFIAQGVEAFVLLWAHEGAWGFRALERRHLRALWKVGLPTALQFALEVGAFALLAGMLASLSELDMAAHQIALQVVQFSFLPAFAVAEAAAVLAGQAVGARADELVGRVARLALATTAVYTGLCSLVMILGAPWLVAGFTAAPALGALAVKLLHVAAVFQVFDGANIVARCTLRGTGDVRFAAVVGVVTSWAFTPPLTWLLGARLHLGAYGGWLGLCGEIICGALILWWRLQRGGWRRAAAQLALTA